MTRQLSDMSHWTEYSQWVLGCPVLQKTHHQSRSHLTFPGSHSKATAAVTIVSTKPGLLSVHLCVCACTCVCADSHLITHCPRWPSLLLRAVRALQDHSFHISLFPGWVRVQKLCTQSWHSTESLKNQLNPSKQWWGFFFFQKNNLQRNLFCFLATYFKC